MLRKTRQSAFQERDNLWKRWKIKLTTEPNLKFWLYRLKWHLAPRFKITTPFPTNLDIEVTNLCNLRCVMCPHGFDDPQMIAFHQKNLGFIDLQLVKRIIDEGMAKGLCAIKFNWRGEPLLHPDLPAMIKYAKQKGILEVMINTNGQLLTPQKGEALINAGLDKIIFSCDGATKETYEKTRQGADFEHFIQNIKNFITIRNSKGLKKPLVRIQMVKMDSNLTELNDFIKMWQPLVDSITTQDYTERGEKTKRLSSAPKSMDRLPCPQIWQRMVITWDGKIAMCCRDWFLKNILGEIKNQSIQSFWKGKKLNKIRQLHHQKKLSKINPCRECTLKETFYWGKK